MAAEPQSEELTFEPIHEPSLDPTMAAIVELSRRFELPRVIR